MSFPSVEWWPSGAWGAFWLFMLPIGPTKAAGILFARGADLGALAILGIYVAKDVATACYVEPLLRLAGQLGPRYGWSRSLAGQIRALAERTHLGTGWAAQVASLAVVGFGAGFMTGAAALPSARVARPLGWAGVILGDVCWFSFVLAATIGLSSVLPDQRLVFGATVLLWLVARPFTKRLSPVSAPVRAAE